MPSEPQASGLQSQDSQPLEGAPEVVLFRQDGADIEVLGWRPGETGLAVRHTVHGALVGVARSQSRVIAMSPNGRYLLVQVGPSTLGDPSTVRVFLVDETVGREVWSSTIQEPNIGAAFFPTGQLVLASTAPFAPVGTWTIVDLVGDDAVVHEVDMPALPVVEPSASIDVRTHVFAYRPFAMSADGRWLYAVSAHGSEPMYRPAYRIPLDGGKPQTIDSFPVAGASRIVSPAIDGSGRILLAGPLSTPAEGSVEAWSAGSSTPDFRVDLGVVFAAAWTEEGAVVAGAYDRVPGPFTFRVLSVSDDGELGPTYLTAEGDNAALVGVSNGFVAAYVTWNDSDTRQLIVVRLEDGSISRIEVPEPDGMIETVGYRP